MLENEKKYHRKEVATEQLKTAVLLFLNRIDDSSVITLANATSNILTQLVRNSGKEPFIDYACRVHDGLVGTTPPREKYNHHIDKVLGATAYKHMSENCSETVELDLYECAICSITRAIADYTILYGEDEQFVKAFLQWAWVNKDGPAIMETFRNMPKKIKRK